MLPESVYRDLFVRQYDGVPEVRVPFGRIDVVATAVTSAGIARNGEPYTVWLSRLVVEVEPLASWQHGVRQALAYAAITVGRKRHPLGEGRYSPAVAIYGDIAEPLARRLFRQTHPYIELFLLSGTTWVHIPDPRVAGAPYQPASDVELLRAAAASDVA